MRKIIYALIKTALFCVALAGFSATAALADGFADDANASTPSRLIEDDRGVLWVKPGADKRHPRGLAAALSQHPPHFVIYASTTDEYEDRAIKHALMLADWFEAQPNMPDHVPVVAFKSKYNTHFYFQICGLSYTHADLAPDGKMGPQATYKVRDDAVLDYRAALVLQARGDYDFLPSNPVEVVRNQSYLGSQDRAHHQNR